MSSFRVTIICPMNANCTAISVHATASPGDALIHSRIRSRIGRETPGAALAGALRGASARAGVVADASARTRCITSARPRSGATSYSGSAFIEVRTAFSQRSAFNADSSLASASSTRFRSGPTSVPLTYHASNCSILLSMSVSASRPLQYCRYARSKLRACMRKAALHRPFRDSDRRCNLRHRHVLEVRQVYAFAVLLRQTLDATLDHLGCLFH